MLRFKVLLGAALWFGGFSQLCAQSEGLNLKVFGYFQASFGRDPALDYSTATKSFSLQQLNLFLQKDFSPNWRTFISFEYVNSYSSLRNWGAQKLEEAWISYRPGQQFKLKAGLQVPTFNHLNEIKNKTQLLPYIIRPLVYESSFNEIIALDEFVPSQAFVQAYGAFPWRELKVDYAAYVGNSSNINSDPGYGQTGLDTTKTFLVGGRLGLSWTDNVKIGVSATFDRLDFSEAAARFNYPIADFNNTPRVRWGGDFLLKVKKFSWESEFIRVTYDDDHPQFNFDKEFFYGTAGYHFTEPLFVYGSYWITRENFLPLIDRDIYASTAGGAYHCNDNMVLKAQYAHARFKRSRITPLEARGNYYYLAVSVFF